MLCGCCISCVIEYHVAVLQWGVALVKRSALGRSSRTALIRSNDSLMDVGAFLADGLDSSGKADGRQNKACDRSNIE